MNNFRYIINHNRPTKFIERSERLGSIVKLGFWIDSSIWISVRDELRILLN